jgi:PAS domain S-box-containing protein
MINNQDNRRRTDAKSRLRFLLPVVAALCFSAVPPALGLEFTAKEQAWLDEGQTVRVGPAPDFPPVEFFDEEGRFAGMAADYLEILRKAVPAEFQVVRLGSWGEVVEETRAGRVDVWLEAARTPERNRFMVFTEPYIELPAVIITRRDLEGPLSLKELADLKIVGVEGYATLDHIRSELPRADLVIASDIPAGLQMVSYGSAEAIVVGTGPASYYIEKLGLTNLHAVGESGFTWRLALAVRKDLPQLHSVLAKAIDEIDDHTHQEIARRWTYLGAAPEKGDFNLLLAIAIAMAVLFVLTGGYLVRRRGRERDRPVFMSVDSVRTGRNWPFYVGIGSAFVVVIAFSLLTQRIFVEQAKRDVGRALQGVLNTTSLAVDHWLQEQRQSALAWTRHMEVAEVSLGLLEGTWQGGPPSKILEEQFGVLMEDETYKDFSVVNASGTILASTSHGVQAGETVSPQTRAMLDRILQSDEDTGVMLPFDRPSGEIRSSHRNDFIQLAAVVRDGQGRGLGALIFALDPDLHFTQILQRGRMGESGESYAFNRAGKLISESRFDDDLRNIGLIPRGERGILNVDIRDPGGNMVEGFHSDIERTSQPLTYMASEAIAGRPGMSLDPYNDYRGVPVIGAWTWNEAVGLGITTEIDDAEAYHSLRTVRGYFRTATAVTLVLILSLGVFFQIDKRRRQHLMNRIRASEERTKSLLDSTPDPMVIVDDKGVMLFANEQVTGLLGYTMGELVGESVEILVPDRVKDVHPGFRKDYVAAPRAIYLHDRRGMSARTKDGREVPISLSLNPIEIEGEGLLVAAALRDETERLKARDQLDLRAAALKAAANGIVITDRNGIIQWVNPAFSELTGYAFDEAVGETPRVLNSGVHEDAFFQKMWQTIISGAVWFGEVVNKRKDDTLYTEEMTITPVFDEGGDIIYFVAIKQDITARKEMETQLERAREEAESANRAKSAFLANMSHELRTPMNAIIGYSEMLAEDAEEEGHDEMIPDLNKIHTAGMHLLDLINDILDLSKIEAGRMDLYLESFDLESMLQESLATLEPLVTKNNNTLVTDFADDLGSVRADLIKVRQALFNLVSNAAKFTENGTITISARRTRAEDGGTLRIDVTDTGIGIPEDKLDQVFEEFGQADNSTTKEYGGTGLGLPISRRFCQMMGGDITVVSEPGAGSTFSIILPSQVDALEVARASASANAEGDSAEVIAGPDPILIIDDDPNARDLLSRTLTSEGYAVATAGDGEEGLALARSKRPSVITLDVQMPGMDGWSVLKTLKADPNLRDIPVIMVSIVGDQKTGYALGAVESLSKPVDREVLIQIVSRYSSGTKFGTALIVEDDAANRSLLARTLSGAGWQVMQAENGAVGLERLAEALPDLILLDLMMPVMDGFEFVLELRSREECRAIPVIVVTSKDLTDEDRFKLTGGVEHIIQKGAFSREKFLKDVSSLVEQHKIKSDVKNVKGSADSGEKEGDTK